MTAVARPTPHGQRREPDGPWTVFDTGPDRAERQRSPVALKSPGPDAGNPAPALSRDTAASPSRLHRYAIQGLPGKH
ncbi:hypothetical protein OCK02_07755 [Rhizobium sp. TRM96647]|uniref:hypothetical protein n=1 Tax=unclassified Rhizobium TaxID=2613769 RepID=UPI0021E70DFC|nr:MULTISPECIES: hypothetical protein [unclassified Rhizobium]MCV3736096.1 hypothetical protein [Rhizobium sp. TRM96647]MCV3758242.1 hypothetical protein [Rhizobium sp. TRM96650]